MALEDRSWCRFVAAFGSSEGIESRRDEVSESLAEALDRGREAYPELAPDEGDFVAFIGERLPADADPVAALARLPAADLLLAFHCAQGDPTALEIFDRDLAPVIEAALARLRLAAPLAQEVTLSLREQLFVHYAPRGCPLIATYGGSGALKNWIRVVTLRTAGKALGRAKREVATDDAFLEEVLPKADDPELALLKDRYRTVFAAAFRAALRMLSPRQRNLLRQSCVDGLSIDALGRLYDVHRATAARWVQRAKEEALQLTRQQLAQSVAITAQNLDSLMGLIGGDLDITLGSFLAADDSEG